MGSQELDTTERLNHHSGAHFYSNLFTDHPKFFSFCIKERRPWGCWTGRLNYWVTWGLVLKQCKMYRLVDSVGEGEGGMFWENSIETSVLSRVKQITSPGWMHETSAQGWCTGKTQRDEMGREAGWGIGMGNTCKSMADSCQCMTKTTTIL